MTVQIGLHAHSADEQVHQFGLGVTKNCALICTEFTLRSKRGLGEGSNDFVPVLGGNGTKIASIRDLFDQPSSQMR